MAKINLRKFIAEHYKAGIRARDVIREALTNAIHAGAKEINVDLQFSDRQPDLLSGDTERRFLEQIAISDNGEGFTPDNLEYFDEICTGHKDSIGGKGVGRLAFLKYARVVEIRSQMSESFAAFDYTPDFTLEDVERKQISGPAKTTVTLREPKEQINTQVANLVNSICDDLRLMLFLKNQSGQSITIHFSHNSGQPFEDKYSFSGEDVQARRETSFELDGETFHCYLFREEAPRKGIVAMLCADDLFIEEYSISKRFDVCRHLISVSSPYFNRHSNIVRQRLELPEKNSDADMASPISREKLFPRIQRECMDMIDSADGGDVQKFRASNVEKLRKHYPFIRVDSIGSNTALIDADEIVKEYRVQLARREDQIVQSLESGRPVSFDDVSHLASEDLARFIVHRALIIQSLADMPADSAEDALHRAILRRRSDGSDLRENNVWLVDDKFLSYSNIFSDESLSRIVSEVTDEVAAVQKRRPDVAAFFSKDSENKPNKLVLIEFKKPEANVFENNKALAQCRFYASELADRISSVREVFAFSIVEIDDAFYRDMKQTGFKDVFSLSERVMYNDFLIGANNDIPLHLYVMSSFALVRDAKARNRVFEEVLQFDPTK